MLRKAAQTDPAPVWIVRYADVLQSARRFDGDTRGLATTAGKRLGSGAKFLEKNRTVVHFLRNFQADVHKGVALAARAGGDRDAGGAWVKAEEHDPSGVEALMQICWLGHDNGSHMYTDGKYCQVALEDSAAGDEGEEADVVAMPDGFQVEAGEIRPDVKQQEGEPVPESLKKKMENFQNQDFAALIAGSETKAPAVAPAGQLAVVAQLSESPLLRERAGVEGAGARIAHYEQALDEVALSFVQEVTLSVARGLARHGVGFAARKRGGRFTVRG